MVGGGGRVSGGGWASSTSSSTTTSREPHDFVQSIVDVVVTADVVESLYTSLATGRPQGNLTSMVLFSLVDEPKCSEHDYDTALLLSKFDSMQFLVDYYDARFRAKVCVGYLRDLVPRNLVATATMRSHECEFVDGTRHTHELKLSAFILFVQARNRNHTNSLRLVHSYTTTRAHAASWEGREEWEEWEEGRRGRVTERMRRDLLGVGAVLCEIIDRCGAEVQVEVEAHLYDADEYDAFVLTPLMRSLLECAHSRRFVRGRHASFELKFTLQVPIDAARASKSLDDDLLHLWPVRSSQTTTLSYRIVSPR